MSFQTAYLKHFYPEHYYASLMTSEGTDGKALNVISSYINECKDIGIKIEPPNINESGDVFVSKSKSIMWRINAIKDVGESAVKELIKMRPITSFDDLMERRSTSAMKVNVITSLIKAGCFDFENTNRNELIDKLNKMTLTKKKLEQYQPIEYSDKIKLEWEKEVLGTYLSDHPMRKYSFKDLSEYQDNGRCLTGGIVDETKIFNDKRGNEMAFIYIDSTFGRIKILLFSSTWAKNGMKELFQVGKLVLVRGKRSGFDVICESAEELI